MARDRRLTHMTLLLGPLAILSCTLSLLQRPPAPIQTQAPPTPGTSLPAPTPFPTTAVPPMPGPTAATAPPTARPATAFCEDQKPLGLMAQFEAALVTEDGALMASLVSPEHGMEARLFRDGRVVTYDREHAAALFESTFAVNWGLAPGSGLPAVGSFRERILPDLRDVFDREYILLCNQVRVGGVTYTAEWPYSGLDFYSAFYSGSDTYDRLDWHTWLLGMHYIGDRPYLYAIMQFKWEP